MSHSQKRLVRRQTRAIRARPIKSLSAGAGMVGAELAGSYSVKSRSLANRQPTATVKRIPRVVSPLDPTDDAIPREVRLGYWAIAAFLLLLLVWAASIPLATGAIAPGFVGVDGHSKVVQHLTGGRISQILINEGDLVRQGQNLVLLETNQLEAKYRALKSRYTLLLARASRLQAESDGLSGIVFSDWLLNRMDDAEVVEAVNHQKRIFRSNLNLLHEKELTNNHRINQANTLALSDQSRLSTLRNRSTALDSELGNYEDLLRKGLVTRNQTYSLKNSRSEMREQAAALSGSINSYRSRIAQYRAEISEYKMTQKNNAVKELDSLQDQIASTRKDLASTGTLLKQTAIKAPITGYIANLKVNTIGGVVAPGAEIMRIVPNNEELIVEAHIDPKDRDSVAVGQTAEIRFSAFNRRSTLPINGQVTYISADRLLDAANNTAYYNARIKLVENPRDKLNGEKIHPGMQTEVIIKTGKRTAIDYFLSPVTRSFDRALREN